jgi:hypothetical protein
VKEVETDNVTTSMEHLQSLDATKHPPSCISLFSKTPESEQVKVSTPTIEIEQGRENSSPNTHRCCRGRRTSPHVCLDAKLD